MSEKISAFIDSELDDHESRSFATTLLKDPQSRAAWRRYQVYGAALREELPSALAPGFAARVAAALEEEPVRLNPSAVRRRHRWLAPLTGAAVAASVLGIAILLQKPVIESESTNQLASSARGTGDAGLIVANSRNENVRERINRLLVEHNEFNPAADMTGMMPYSRFVSYPADSR